ncbi:MAG: dTMP kinase [Fimbriiglobus sp.]
MPKPLFIAFDGIDGTGKSTLCQWLTAKLEAAAIPTTKVVDPGGTELGAKLREILLHGRADAMSMRTEALLFMASRAELVAKKIRPALERDEVVISDRYVLANIVYQGYGGGLDLDSLRAVGEFSTEGILPNLTCVFDMPVDAAQERRGRSADRMELRQRDFHERVRAGFLTEANQNPGTITIIHAEQSLVAVRRQVLDAVNPWLLSSGRVALDFTEADDAVE